MYVANFTAPDPYVIWLFSLLASTIDEEAITEKTNRQFRAIGQFFQTHRITEPLTWQAIEELLPPLGATNRAKPKMVRESLIALGHLMAARGLMESREIYLEKRRIAAIISRAPQHIQPTLQLHASWLQEHKFRRLSVQINIEALASFWSWCYSHGIKYPREVSTPIINNYIMTLYWQLSCSNCQAILAFGTNNHRESEVCPHCGCVGSLVKVRRYAQETVIIRNCALRVFFDWTQINHTVLANPVRRKIIPPDFRIRHYPVEDIKRLCQCIWAPDSDPVEALTLYLIIFHTLSVWELRHAQIPRFDKLYKDIKLPSLADSYYILVPKPEPSRGDRDPGRPSIRVDFPVEAAGWLKPLLERFEQKRQQTSKNPTNTYLLVSSHTALHDIPISAWLVQQIVRRASKRVLGGTCTSESLRITAAMMFADRSNGGILKWLGLSERHGFQYSYAAREVVHPTPHSG